MPVGFWDYLGLNGLKSFHINDLVSDISEFFPMRRASGKRLPHGATTAMVLAKLMQLHSEGGMRRPVSRAELVRALKLPESTVDDRLRTLVYKEEKVTKVRQGHYVPKPLPGEFVLKAHEPGSITTVYDGTTIRKALWLD